MLPVLFIGSLVVLGLFLAIVYSMSRETDRQDDKAATNNQLRLAAWILAIFIALAAAAVEFFIVVK